MQYAELQDLQRDIAKAYEADDLIAAVHSLTEAFEKRRGNRVRETKPIADEAESKVVKDWRDLLGPGGPDGETAEDFLGPIYELRDSSEPRNAF
ncbi:hypothetical protein LF1_51480 [Rubripirellula obstinata]|uniref:Uncharacterized protein n=1 Tax=Rubripirellula obstinata TaxID=406547 RepID=A0A5B1CQQ7_9BACT|nr:hypothetical protein [Rubripirellula obstinata]KAA1262581.1 hypothetical protein LF1_51480 [Rubripirellula obstinata]